MPIVLALEPDDRQTDFLRAIVCDQLRASLVVAGTSEAAVAAISAGMPDVVLVSPDFPPREAIEIKDHLRSLQPPTAFEIIRMPEPSRPPPPKRVRRGILGTLRRQPAGASEGGAERGDAEALAGRIAGALDRVRSARENVPTRGSANRPTPERSVTREPAHETRTASKPPRPGLTCRPPRLEDGGGKPRTTTASPGNATLDPPDPADGDQDEWGFFDPGRCGYAALAVTLGTLPEEVQQNGEASPADMLLKLETGADTAERPQLQTAVTAAPTCQKTPPVARRARRQNQPAPLALWAHLFG